MSVSTMSTNGTRQYRRSASSILSSDSDIRFTRRKLSRQYKCGCCILASFLMLLLAGAAAIYVGYTFYFTQPAEEQVFRASFNVMEGDVFQTPMADLQTEEFRVKARDYKERLNLLFRRSNYRLGFAGTDILALDGTEGKDLVVHFDIHIDPTYTTASAKDLQTLISNEVALEQESLYFRNLTIDPHSVEVIENHVIKTTTARPSTYQIVSEAVTQTPIRRKCSPLQLDYCKKMNYNLTTYPNIMGHNDLKDLKKDVISFRELVDGECYRLAYDFICNVLQPRCARGPESDEMLLPCRSYCRDFMTGCGGRLTSKIKEALDCNKFPEFHGDGSCIPKPGCVQEMQTRALSPRICDGVVDCQDLSDEKSCAYCPSNYIHCGIGRACIKSSKRCDGKRDCPDGSDERACLTLAPSIQQMTKVKVVTPHLPRYHPEGYVVFNEKGEMGKLCTENLNSSIPANKTAEILHMVASSLCKTLSYESVTSVQVEKDAEDDVAYVSMDDPTASEISFVRSECPTKQVLKVSCANLECGVQVTHEAGANPVLAKMSAHGDWPWHMALFKDDVHICDGTLVSPNWVVTTTSCFQGQPKAEWLVRAGSVRLSSSSPWQQERRIVGMVKSPVEGSTIAMVKLEEPLMMTDFVRPVCLPQQLQASDALHCNTLGWARNRDQLQRVEIKVTVMEKCENISISSVNSLCTETAYGQEDCSEEEFAGSPMHCQVNDGTRWSLIGVTNWRIACAKNGMERPRLYDKIVPNIDWIQETIKADTI
ncbi:atrial natriuretic peptide-converting enzyme-like [Atheta coriaria]